MSFWQPSMQPNIDRTMSAQRCHWCRLSGEALRFLVGGAINTLATFILYWVLLRFVSYPMAYTLSFVTGIGLSYALNALFVFRVRPAVRSALAFPLVYLAQYLVGFAVLWLWASVLEMPPAYGVLAVVAVSLPITFVLSRYVLEKLK